MVQQFSLVHEGITHYVDYEVCDDTLLVYLPNGEIRRTELRGLDAESAARPHLRSYLKNTQAHGEMPDNW
ncbi:hypothetical protein F0170_09565 [Pseudomonas sp. MAFF 730085]|uniref:Uncharacterized protein n=1 Tax=Pseudomonas kitaguniensis TaxID=2607908 RepID=A0A5N7JS88_9PSED|nr:hypothetical protein [Pseudomonas kitaguniensis]MPQ84211.1 hypothetical protein [Pseudomonas kitaguniensis]